MKNNILLLTLLLVSLSDILFAVNPYKAGDSLQIFAKTGLRIREAPNGKVMDVLPYGESVVMLQDQPTTGQQSIDHMNGYWVKVGWNDMEGYVFDAFLSILPAMNPNATDLQYYCHQHFKVISDKRSVDSNGDSIRQTEFRYKGQKIVYNERFNSPDAEMFFGIGKLVFSNISLEEVFLLFLMTYGYDTNFGSKIRPTRQLYDFPDYARTFGFDNSGIHWNWSH